MEEAAEAAAAERGGGARRRAWARVARRRLIADAADMLDVALRWSYVGRADGDTAAVGALMDRRSARLDPPAHPAAVAVLERHLTAMETLARARAASGGGAGPRRRSGPHARRGARTHTIV